MNASPTWIARNALRTLRDNNHYHLAIQAECAWETGHEWHPVHMPAKLWDKIKDEVERANEVVRAS